MSSEWALSVRLIPTLRTTWLASVTLLVAAATAPPLNAAAPPGARQNVARPRSSLALPGPSDELLARLEAIYKDLHANPELSMQEQRTARIAAEWLRQYGYEVTEKVGGTGVVGLLRNGEGATVLLRADMDALPMKESSGLAYASTRTGKALSGEETALAHSCGHDMHVTWLMGATSILAENRERWRGTVVAVFQPAEETGEGARAMVADGMINRFPKPDITLAQHVMSLPAGRIAIRSGPVLSMSDSWEVKLFGRGGHGSGPENTVDPVVMAAASVMRLQTVVSREISMMDRAVVTVGALQAGSSPNIIPDEALLRLNVRTFDEQVRETVLAAIKRIINAEATASQAPKPPAFTSVGEFPLTTNDATAALEVTAALENRFGSDVHEGSPATASEDFSTFARAWKVPSVFWFVGGTDPQRYAEAEKANRLNELPSNHSPQFAPVISPTLRVGIEAMLAAAGPWLSDGAGRAATVRPR